MNDVNEQRLAARMHRELRSLPDRQAPKTLAPRVLAAIAARQARSWYRDSWIHWPAGMRALFLVVGAAVLGSLAFAGFQLPYLFESMGGVGSSFTDSFTWLKPYLEVAARVGTTVLLVVKAIPQQLLWSLVAVIALAYALCVGLGPVGYRLALNRI